MESDITLSKQKNRGAVSLSYLVVWGSFWLLFLRVVTLLLKFLQMLVLARLLSPYDFGLMGIAILAITALETLSETGFQAALVQKKGDIAPYLDSAWTVAAFRGLILALILFLSSPWIALFFREQNAVLILRVIAICAVLKGFSNIGIVNFQRDLEFHKQATYEFSGTLAGFVIAVVCGLIFHNVWALVFGLIAKNAIGLFISYFLSSYRPRLDFNIVCDKELFNFGKWITLVTIVVFLSHNGDNAFVGRILGVVALGFYQLAYVISNFPATEISDVISQVSFPSYSKIGHDTEKLRAGYLRVVKLTTFLTAPIALGMLSVAFPLVAVLLGEKWIPMIFAMQILCVWGLERSIIATTPPLFKAAGAPQFHTFVDSVRLAALVLFIYPLTAYAGIAGTAVSVLLAALFADSLGYILVTRIIRCSLFDLFKTVFLPLFASVTMAFSLLACRALWFPNGRLLDLSALVIIGVIIYITIICVYDRFFGGHDLAGDIKFIIASLFAGYRYSSAERTEV
jgi:O-antigen/teichoic acid export membrane protein